MKHTPFDAMIAALGVVILRARGISSDCGVGITPQMCNRVTDHGDMGIFSRPVDIHI